MVSFNKQQVISDLQNGDNEEVARALLTILYDVQQSVSEVLNSEQQNFFEDYVKTFLEVFADTNFTIPDNFKPLFAAKAPILSNIIACTSFKNTDELVLKIAQNQQNHDLSKLIAVYSHRNAVRIELKEIFAIQPFLASCWWVNMIAMGRRTQVSLQTHEKLKTFLNILVLEQYLQLPIKTDGSFFNESFFSSINYIDPNKDAAIKRKINHLIEQANFYPDLKLDIENADYSKVAVLSRNFRKGHATYKAVAPLFSSLKEGYELTVINICKDEDSVAAADYDLFNNVIFLNEDNKLRLPSREALQKIADEKFGTIFFADIGQEIISAILANQRLAPIQLSCYGNPASSQSKNIDYFVVSENVEPENPEQYYSEKLVFIPGNAVMAVTPDCEIPDVKKENENEIIVSCSWGNAKCNYGYIKQLKTIIDRTSRNVKFMFVGLENRNFINVAFKKELEETLSKDSVITTYAKPYKEYLADIAGSDFGIDSYPWGGYNRLMDCLSCGKPIIALEGDIAFNRLAQALLRQLGLEELIAKDENELIEKTLRLIEDDKYRNELSHKIKAMDLGELIADGSEKYMKKALDYLIANKDSGERLIKIKEDKG
jgi:predicted O-linked N-acetylglucosamine transferase (SPINDLY family)